MIRCFGIRLVRRVRLTQSIAMFQTFGVNCRHLSYRGEEEQEDSMRVYSRLCTVRCCTIL